MACAAYVRNHLHRYVVHIKKHIVKRKDSFKRSVAKWDPIYNTTHMDGSSETGKVRSLLHVRLAQIAALFSDLSRNGRAFSSAQSTGRILDTRS